MELTRRYSFPAAHVLTHASLSAEENCRVYGKCANPNGHGHDYQVELTMRGARHPQTGRIVELDLLDEIYQQRVGSRFSHRMLNDDPAFAELVPTGENLALVIHEELADELERRSTARLVRVRVVETRRNAFEYGAVQ